MVIIFGHEVSTQGSEIKILTHDTKVILIRCTLGIYFKMYIII
jgi:hypothetical protein